MVLQLSMRGKLLFRLITVESKKIILQSFSCSMVNCKNLLKLLKILKTNGISVVFTIENNHQHIENNAK